MKYIILSGILAGNAITILLVLSYVVFADIDCVDGMVFNGIAALGVAFVIASYYIFNKRVLK